MSQAHSQLLSPGAAHAAPHVKQRRLQTHSHPNLRRHYGKLLHSRHSRHVKHLRGDSVDETLAESLDAHSGKQSNVFDTNSSLEDTNEGEEETGDYTEAGDLGGAASRDPWEPWEDGPLLRADSFTAQQLFYITAEAVYLESRRVFIGDFPENWVETNASTWLKTVQQRMERLGIRDSEHEERRLYTAVGIEEQRRVVDLQLAADLVEDGGKAVEARSRRRSKLTREMQRRRRGFRSKKLANVSIDGSDISETAETVAQFREPPTRLPSEPPKTEDGLGKPEMDASSSNTAGTEFFDCTDGPAPPPAPPRVVVFSTPTPSESSLETASYESRATSCDAPEEDPKAGTLNDRASFKAAMASFRNFVSNTQRNRKLSTASAVDPLSTESDAPSLAPSATPPLAPAEAPGVSKNSPKTPPKAASRASSLIASAAPSTQQSSASAVTPAKTLTKSSTKSSSKSPSVMPSRSSSVAPSDVSKNTHLKPGSSFLPHLGSARTGASSRRYSSVVQALFAQSWRPHNPLRRSKHRKEKIYQGRFLVQERESRSPRPIIDEIEMPLATQLVSRWKECSVFARLTDNRDKPLMLYVYEHTSPKKLAKRTQRSWTRKLEYKIAVDRYYEIAFFSPLDLTLALWRPRLAGERRHHHLRRKSDAPHQTLTSLDDDAQKEKQDRDHTKILLFQAQSIAAIMDLAFLFSSATNAAEHLYGQASWAVGLPALGIHTIVKSDRTFSRTMGEMRSFDGIEDRYVPYRDLLSPTVSSSSTLNMLMRIVYTATKKLLDRLELDGDGRAHKYTLAWVINHRPLWLPSTSSSLYPITRLNWLMKRHGNLVMVEPKPKCYLGNTLKEPAALEGCALSVNMSFSSAGAVANKLTAAVTMTANQHPHSETQTHSNSESDLQSESPAKLQEQAKSKPRPQSKLKRSTVKAWSVPQYIFTCDQYLLYAPTSSIEPPFLAASQNSLEKRVEPYPLDESGKHIPWVKYSTCLHEIDYHDVVAKLELERRTKLISSSRGLLNLTYIDSFSANDRGDLILEGLKGRSCTISFGSREVAEVWAEKLGEIAYYWKEAHKAHIIQRAAVSGPDFTISPFLQNRAIVFSGSLFIKKHHFATFKPYHVILTVEEMVIFKVDQKRRPPAHANQNLPASSLHHQHYRNLSLKNSYIYSGQVANHALLNDDSHIDPSNPGTRALPRAYEDGLISQDTELDRCFVIWQTKDQRLPMMNSSKAAYFAFLAQEKDNRDHWVAAIRHVQTYLSAENFTATKEVDFSDSEAEENAFFG